MVLQIRADDNRVYFFLASRMKLLWRMLGEVGNDKSLKMAGERGQAVPSQLESDSPLIKIKIFMQL